MFEKVNPSHPDKVADRIAGALVDLAYTKAADPKIAVEVLIGHGICTVIAETSEKISQKEVEVIVDRIAGSGIKTQFVLVPQDEHLAKNQDEKLRCGDNGIFKGTPVTEEQRILTSIAGEIYEAFPSDGKYLLDLDKKKVVLCQSNSEYASNVQWFFNQEVPEHAGYDIIVNPLGSWTGGVNVDSGATNRKLGSDMGDGVTGGGLHGKDLSKADVTLNTYCYLMAQQEGHPYSLSCAIGDEKVDGQDYQDIVELVRNYIKAIGGFEKFAEWGLIRP